METKIWGVYFEEWSDVHEKQIHRCPLSDLDGGNSSTTRFQIQPTVSPHRGPRKADVPQRNIRPSPSAGSKTTTQTTSIIQPLKKTSDFPGISYFLPEIYRFDFFFFFEGQRDACSPSSAAPKHIWSALLLFKSRTGSLFVGRRRGARAQLAPLPQLGC